MTSMKELECKIISNTPAAEGVFRMILLAESNAMRVPGQFINIRLDGFYTRRPISVCDYDENGIWIFYKVVGDGTEVMSQMPAGANLNVLTGLGNGFDTKKSGHEPLLVGGGIGVSPLYGLCRRLLAEGKQPSVLLGFNRESEIILAEEFQALGVPVSITTVDGSAGRKGFVTDAMAELRYTYLYTCGPTPMLRAVNAAAKTSGQFSFEARMGCGFGACMSCSCKTLFGSKRVCKDGPVFEREEILWQS